MKTGIVAGINLIFVFKNDLAVLYQHRAEGLVAVFHCRGGKLDRLPEKLQQTAKLRLEHPELSLSQLAELCDPPVSKSCMNHRMRKLNEEAKKLL